MIEIKKSETADSRSCDWGKVTEEQLLSSSKQHIQDVKKGLDFFKEMLDDSAKLHDFDKISKIKEFHEEFKTDFKEQNWLNSHYENNRHHLTSKTGVPDDVNLIDVLEYISDCVMAGLGRSGKVYDVTLPSELLQKAFKNTVEKLKDNVEVE